MKKVSRPRKVNPKFDVPELRTFTLEEIGKQYHVTTRSLLRYIEQKRLKADRIGKKLQVSQENLARFLSGKR